MSLEELGEEREVARGDPRGPLIRLLASLVGAGLLAGALIAGAAAFTSTIAQTDAGLCRITFFPCTDLSEASVGDRAQVDLPQGTVVESSYLQGDDFRARVVLPADGGLPLGVSYSALRQPPPEFDRALDGLSELTFWTRPGENPGTTMLAAAGTDSDGRTVILFDTRTR